MPTRDVNIACVGFRPKTGRAVAVVLAGPTRSPRVLKRVEISLVDPSDPATGQPYHEVMELPWPQAVVRVKPIIKAIEAIAAKAVADLKSEALAQNLNLAGVGIVGPPDRQLERIGNPHIRAHAAEGVLFRRVLEFGASRNGLVARTFAEHDFETFAAGELGYGLSKLRAFVLDLGGQIGPPWRVDHRLATLAAWLTLNSIGMDNGRPVRS